MMVLLTMWQEMHISAGKTGSFGRVRMEQTNGPRGPSLLWAMYSAEGLQLKQLHGFLGMTKGSVCTTHSNGFVTYTYACASVCTHVCII